MERAVEINALLKALNSVADSEDALLNVAAFLTKEILLKRWQFRIRVAEKN